MRKQMFSLHYRKALVLLILVSLQMQLYYDITVITTTVIPPALPMITVITARRRMCLHFAIQNC